MLGLSSGAGAGLVTSIERTAYPRFKRLITAHELHLFFSPTRDEVAWASGVTDGDEHLLALLLMLKSYQRMGCFPRLDDVPEMVVDFVRRAVELPDGTLPLYQAVKTAKNHRGLVRQRVGVVYDQAEARRIAEASIRSEAAAKNRPADLINIALEKVVGAGLELPAFSTLDTMASTVRKEVNASICAGIHDRMSAVERAGLLRLLEERDADGTTQYNRLKKFAQSPTWSHFKRLIAQLEWLDGLDGAAEGHGLRRGGGCGGRVRTEGVHAGQAGRVDGVPGAQGTDAGAGRAGADVLQAGRVEDEEGEGGAGGAAARRAGDDRDADRQLPHGAQAPRRRRPGPGGAGEGRRDDRRGSHRPSGPGRTGASRRGRPASGGEGLPGGARLPEGHDGAGRRAGHGDPGGGGVRRVRQGVRADREGLRPPRQLLGGAAVRADRPGPGPDVRPGREAGVRRDLGGPDGAGRARARPPQPGRPRRVHQRAR
ncbi:DUF4158 domain-containing protein [Streptomyces sp. NPDC058086]|uniref:DUF4158 domain-containing protein n=1 Tax=Streptomyces sp. NPDC058086 TaxID=3346334 RepID=UPI0036E14AAF